VGSGSGTVAVGIAVLVMESKTWFVWLKWMVMVEEAGALPS
jgi:hypothetical protein